MSVASQETELPPSSQLGLNRREHWSRFVRKLTSAQGVTLLTIVAFTTVGAYSRLESLGTGSIWNDEAETTLLAYSVLSHGYPIIHSARLVNVWAPLYPYLEALSIRLLGGSNLAYRLPAAILGTAMIPVAYLVGAKLRDRFVGIAFAGIVAFSTEFIAWSRQARWYSLILLLLDVGLLVVVYWYRSSSSSRRRLLLVSLLPITVLAATASLAIFVVYLPGVLAGVAVYLLAVRWESIKRFFARQPRPDSPEGWQGLRQYRLPLLLAALAWISVGIILGWPALASLYGNLFNRIVGFPPYPVVFSVNYSSQLIDYYPGVLALAAVAAVQIFRKRDPLELALVGLAVGSYLSISVGVSITQGIAGSGLTFERHLEPLLLFLFLLAAIGLVESISWIVRWLARGAAMAEPTRRRSPGAFGLLVVVILVLPGLVIPTNLTVYQNAIQSPSGDLVRWDPFQLFPSNPSALYNTPQPSFQLASDYVLSHRAPSDIIASTDPGAPSVYLGIGSVQFYIHGTTVPGLLVIYHGVPAFYQTDSLLISNSSQLVGLLLNGSGWLISDQVVVTDPLFPGGMATVVQALMTYVPAGSDSTIFLFQWNKSTPVSLLQLLEARSPSLQGFGSNTTQLLDWGTTFGMTVPYYRDFLLSLDGSLVPLLDTNGKPLGVLIQLFNQRPDLQAELPQVIGPYPNWTALIRWAALVTSGSISDPARPLLQPYASWYQNY